MTQLYFKQLLPKTTSNIHQFRRLIFGSYHFEQRFPPRKTVFSCDVTWGNMVFIRHFIKRTTLLFIGFTTYNSSKSKTQEINFQLNIVIINFKNLPVICVVSSSNVGTQIWSLGMKKVVPYHSALVFFVPLYHFSCIA